MLNCREPTNGGKHSLEAREKMRISHLGEKHKQSTIELRKLTLVKPVLQYDLDGNFIKEWESVNDVSRYFKTSSISATCKGKLKTSKGFRWKYKSEENTKFCSLLKKTKIILQYSLKGDLLNEWNSILDIETKYPKFDRSTIYKCCRNSSKTAYSYKWKYKN